MIKKKELNLHNNKFKIQFSKIYLTSCDTKIIDKNSRGYENQ